MKINIILSQFLSPFLNLQKNTRKTFKNQCNINKGTCTLLQKKLQRQLNGMTCFTAYDNETKGMRPVGQKSLPYWKKIFSQLGKFFFPVRASKMDIYLRGCSMAFVFTFLVAQHFLHAFWKFLTKLANVAIRSPKQRTRNKIKTGSTMSSQCCYAACACEAMLQVPIQLCCDGTCSIAVQKTHRGAMSNACRCDAQCTSMRFVLYAGGCLCVTWFERLCLLGPFISLLYLCHRNHQNHAYDNIAAQAFFLHNSGTALPIDNIGISTCCCPERHQPAGRRRPETRHQLWLFPQ